MPKPKRGGTTFRDWLEENMDADELRDLSEHGASGGFSGLTYYSETVALYDRFEDEIWDAMYEDAPVEGMSILSFMASLGGSKDVGSMDQLKNLLVWYMAERTAREIVGE